MTKQEKIAGFLIFWSCGLTGMWRKQRTVDSTASFFYFIFDHLGQHQILNLPTVLLRAADELSAVYEWYDFSFFVRRGDKLTVWRALQKNSWATILGHALVKHYFQFSGRINLLQYQESGNPLWETLYDVRRTVELTHYRPKISCPGCAKSEKHS